MRRRVLAPVERMVDVFDRASTLTFTVVVTVRGTLTTDALEQALRGLERLHPLLRARVERGPTGNALVFGEAPRIPLRAVDGPPAAVWELARRSIEHREWLDAGPRAELTWLRHAPDYTSLLLSFHHLVSDGSSGVFALRDLLRLLSEPGLAPEPLHAPPQNVLYPPGHGNFAWKLRAGRFVAGSLLAATPHRLRIEPADSAAPRRVGLAHLRVAAPQLSALIGRARRDGATVHGVLSAALARGISDAARADAPGVRQRILHAVDLRRYLRAYHPGSADAQEAVGYYVSSVQTVHRIAAAGPLGALARDITEAVRARKAEAEPLVAGPIAGAWVTALARDRGQLRSFRDFLERRVMLGTFSITNLGALEQLGVQRELDGLRVEDFFFVAASSVFSSFLASATTLDGTLTMPICWVEPLVAPELAQCVIERAAAELSAYALGS